MDHITALAASLKQLHNSMSVKLNYSNCHAVEMATAASSGRLAKRFWMKRLDVVVGAISDFPSVPIDALFARNLTNLLI